MPSDSDHEFSPARRCGVVAVGLLLVLGVLSLRLTQLGWYAQQPLREQLDAQLTARVTISARPGDILDRRGRVLASTLVTKSLFLDPSKIDDPWPVATALGSALHIDDAELFESIRDARTRQFLWVKRRMTHEEAERVRSLGLPREAYGFRTEYRRRYPQRALAAHVLGLRGIDNVGRGGIEESFDALLTGTDGERTVVRDARGRVVEVLDQVEQPPVHGSDVVLTIDAGLQAFVEQELEEVMAEWKPRSACGLVMDVQTGELLACASLPDYDPNRPGAAASDAWSNTAVTAMYEPGSTLKPVITAWALQTEAIRKDDAFDCEYGAYRMGPRVLHDHHSYGRLSLTDVLVKSSNIGMAKIGERMGNAQLHRALLHFGFGSQTHLELPGELTGTVRPLDEWTIYSTGSIPMGQELTVTPIQLISAHATIANGGRFVHPTLIRRHESKTNWSALGEGGLETDDARGRLIDEEYASWLVREPMAEVVTRGTGRRARLDEYDIFGKTGTAQKVDPETGGYSHTKHVASFICGGPVEAPRAVVLVVVDEPSTPGNHYGGTVAAPGASRILKHVLDWYEPGTRTPGRIARGE